MPQAQRRQRRLSSDVIGQGRNVGMGDMGITCLPFRGRDRVVSGSRAGPSQGADSSLPSASHSSISRRQLAVQRLLFADQGVELLPLAAMVGGKLLAQGWRWRARWSRSRSLAGPAASAFFLGRARDPCAPDARPGDLLCCLQHLSTGRRRSRRPAGACSGPGPCSSRRRCLSSARRHDWSRRAWARACWQRPGVGDSPSSCRRGHRCVQSRHRGAGSCSPRDRGSSDRDSTTTIEPSYSLSASSSVSRAAMSRWFVGSSIASRLYGRSISLAICSRLRSPPDRPLTILNRRRR